MKSLLTTTALLILLSASAPALTITLDAELLKQFDGSPMPLTGLVVLTAVTSGTIFGPAPTSFTSENELVLAKWDLSAFSMAGAISESVVGLDLQGAWNEADALRMYWYPTLTISSTAPGASTPYGTYSDPVGRDGSDPWITSGPSSTIKLKFLSSDATFLSTPGSNPPQAGVANLQVVPEPSAGLLLGSCGLLLGFLRQGRAGASRA